MNIKQCVRSVSVYSYQDYTGQPSTQPEVDMWPRDQTGQCEGQFLSHTEVGKPLALGFDLSTSHKLGYGHSYWVNSTLKMMSEWLGGKNLSPWMTLGSDTAPQCELWMQERNVCLVWVTVIGGLCYSSLTWSLRALHTPSMLYIFFWADVIFLYVS